jgi:hypothetical protein
MESLHPEDPFNEPPFDFSDTTGFEGVTFVFGDEVGCISDLQDSIHTQPTQPKDGPPSPQFKRPRGVTTRPRGRGREAQPRDSRGRKPTDYTR